METALAASHWNLPIVDALLTDAEIDKLVRNSLDQTALDVFLEKVESEPTTQWVRCDLPETSFCFVLNLDIGSMTTIISLYRMKFEAQSLLRRAIPHLPKALEVRSSKQKLNNNLKLQRKAKEVIQARVEKDREKILTVATLIASITLAAAFAVPGGYIGYTSPEEGLPILLKVTAFKIFIVLNLLTICSSLAAIFLCIFAPWDDTDNVIPYWVAMRVLMILSFCGMATSFGSGMYTILVPEVRWLAVLACAMCCCLPFVAVIWAKWRGLKFPMRQLRKRTSERSRRRG